MKIFPSIHSTLASATIAGLLCFSYGQSEAAPLVTKHIPAKAEGVIHIDVDRLHSSSLWKFVEAEFPKKGKSKEKLSAKVVAAIKGIGDAGIEDLIGAMIRDVRGITIWGVDEDQWAMTVDLPIAATLISAFDSVADLKKSTQRGVSLYAWEKDAFLSVHQGKLIVGPSAKSVVDSVRILDGKGKSIVGRKLGGLNSSSAKGIIVAAGFGGKLMKAISKEAASKALKADIRSVVFFAGEQKKSIYVQAAVTLDSAQTATKLVAVLNGLKGLLALSDDEPEVAALLGGLNVSANGNTIQARVDIPVKTVLKMARDR